MGEVARTMAIMRTKLRYHSDVGLVQVIMAEAINGLGRQD